MKTIYIVIIVIVAVILLAGITTAIYIAAYRKYLSKRISSGITNQTDRKTMVVPFRFFWIMTGIFSILALLFLSLGSVQFERQVVTNSIQLIECTENGLIQKLSAEEEIAGYTRKEIEEDSFQIVYYLKSNNTEPFPAFLMYIESDNLYEYELINEETGYTITSEEDITGNHKWYAIDDNFSGILRMNCANDEQNKDIIIGIDK